MILPSIEFIKPQPMKFQHYLDQISIFECIDYPYIAIADSNNEIYIYKILNDRNVDDAKNNEEFPRFKKISYVFNKKNSKAYKPLALQYIRYIKDKTIAIKYENLDIMILFDYSEPNTNYKFLKNTKHATDLFVLDERTLIYFCKIYNLSDEYHRDDDDDINTITQEDYNLDYGLFIQRWQSEKRKVISIPIRSIHKKIFKISEYVIGIAEGNSFIHIIDIKNNVILRKINADFIEVITTPRNCFCKEDIFFLIEKDLLKIVDLTKNDFINMELPYNQIESSIQAQNYIASYYFNDFIIILYEFSIAIYLANQSRNNQNSIIQLKLIKFLTINVLLDSNKRNDFQQGELHKFGNMIIQSTKMKCFICLIIESYVENYDTCIKTRFQDFVYSFELTDEFLNGKQDLPQLIPIETNKLHRIKAIVQYDSEYLCLLTDNNDILEYDIINNVKLLKEHNFINIEILNIEYINKSSLLIAYKYLKDNIEKNSNIEEVENQLLNDYYLDLYDLEKMVIKKKFRSFLRKKIRIIRDLILLSEKKIICDCLDISKSDDNMKIDIDLPDILPKSKKSVTRKKVSWKLKILPKLPKNPGNVENKLRIINENQQNEMNNAQIETDSLKPSIMTPSPNHGSYKENNLILTENIQNPINEMIELAEISTSEDIENQSKISTNNSELILIDLIQGNNIRKILTSYDINIKFMVELKSSKFLAIAEHDNPKLIHILNMSEKQINKVINFAHRIEQIYKIDDKKAACLVKTYETSISDMIIIFDWKVNAAILVIEYENMGAILSVIHNHLIWSAYKSSSQANVFMSNMKNCKYPTKNIQNKKKSWINIGHSEKVIFTNTSITTKYWVNLTREKGEKDLISNKKAMIYDESLGIDKFVIIEARRIEFETLKILHECLRSDFKKHIIKDIFKFLFPKIKDKSI